MRHRMAPRAQSECTCTKVSIDTYVLDRYERAVSNQGANGRILSEWRTRLFQSRTFRFSRRCAMSYVSVGKENSTDIELYYKDLVGNPVVPDPRMPIERRLMAVCYYSIAVRRTDRHVFTSDEINPTRRCSILLIGCSRSRFPTRKATTACREFVTASVWTARCESGRHPLSGNSSASVFRIRHHCGVAQRA